jgi:hypothetical protein
MKNVNVRYVVYMEGELFLTVINVTIHVGILL